MANKRHRVAIIGCGRLGQYYAEAYTTYPDTEIVAIADLTQREGNKQVENLESPTYTLPPKIYLMILFLI